MPFSGNSWDDSKLIPYRAALRRVLARYPGLQPCAPRANDTARVTLPRTFCMLWFSA